MPDYEVEVSVEVKKPGEYTGRLTWRLADIEIDAPDLQAAAIEGLRQAQGDAALDLGRHPTS